MRPTRRSQPYRKGAAPIIGPARDAMRAGKPAGSPNPMDVQRKLKAKLYARKPPRRRGLKGAMRARAR